VAPPARGGRSRQVRSRVPQRTCVACRQTNAKRQLVRIVRSPDGSVTIDPSGKRSGRGAYLCDQLECWDASLKRGVLPRALKIESIPDESLVALTEYAQRLGVT
jgi:predicted RNA-binding protein YlxR (DUF448 family)